MSWPKQSPTNGKATEPSKAFQKVFFLSLLGDVNKDPGKEKR